MMNFFEAISSELANGHPFADNYEDFVNTMISAIQTALKSPAGQDLVAQMIVGAIESGMSPEEWNQRKADLVKVMFCLTLEECPQLKKEMATHLYNELRKEVSP